MFKIDKCQPQWNVWSISTEQNSTPPLNQPHAKIRVDAKWMLLHLFYQKLYINNFLNFSNFSRRPSWITIIYRHKTKCNASIAFFTCETLGIDTKSMPLLWLYQQFCSIFCHQGRDRFASSGRGISSAGSRIVAHETIDQTETGRRWLTMFTFLRLQLKYKNGQ